MNFKYGAVCFLRVALIYFLTSNVLNKVKGFNLRFYVATRLRLSISSVEYGAIFDNVRT